MKTRGWLVVFVLLLLGGACSLLACADLMGDDDDDDDDTSGDDDDDDDGGRIDDVPDDVNDFLDQEDIDKLKNAGLEIYTGDNPPNIEGSYLANSQITVYDDAGQVGYQPADYIYTFADQTDAGSISHSYDSPDAGDSGSGLGAFISGDGDCFSVFVRVEGSTYECDYEMPEIFSGCLNDEGIADFAIGFIMTDKEGFGCDALIEEGQARIIEEEDGLAEEIED